MKAAPVASRWAGFASAREYRPEGASGAMAMVRRLRTPEPLSGPPLPESSAEPPHSPSLSGKASLTGKRELPGLAARMKFMSSD
jgi:hypothetical protein